MPVSGPQQEDNEATLTEGEPADGVTATGNGVGPADGDAGASPDTAASPDGVVEFDERRAKMERLRAAGIDPYPPVTLWGQRTRIADVLETHDAGALDAGEHPELTLPRRRAPDLPTRARQDRLPGSA